MKEVTKDMYLAQDKDTTYCVIPKSAMPGTSYARLYEYGCIVTTAMTKNLLALKELTTKVHAEVGRSMGIDFQINSLYAMYKQIKGIFTIDSIMGLLRGMVDIGTLPPKDPAFLPAFTKRLEKVRSRRK